MPRSSAPYPLTKGISQYLSLQSRNTEPLRFNKQTTLGRYQKQSVDKDLKKVVHYLKEPLHLFPQIILHAEFSVTTIKTNGSIDHLHWELTIKEPRIDLNCILDALGVLYQGLFHSKMLLKHVEQILGKDWSNGGNEDSVSKPFLDEDDIQKLKVLKENLLKLNSSLDSVLLRYSTFNCKLPSPLIQNIKHAAKKIREVINHLKADKLKNLVPEKAVFSVTEENVLCSALGLHDDFAVRLRNLSEEMRLHKTDEYYLLCFMKEHEELVSVQNMHDIEAVRNGLQKMGFTENRSDVVAKWIARQPFPEHKSLLGWAQIYIENLFKYDIFLNDQVNKFPFRESCLNKWFTVDGSSEEGEAGSVSQISVINTNEEKDAITHIKKKLAEYNDNTPKGQFYFHGTDHISAQNILENGINLNCGKVKCDFSHGNGFYVTDSFECGLEYAQKSKAAALILFNIADDCLKKGLDLSSPERSKDFKSVKDYFRSGAPRKHKLGEKLFNEVKNCHYVIGPISRDGVKSRKWQSAQQICIKNKEIADKIGEPSRIIGIVFLNTEKTQ